MGKLYTAEKEGISMKGMCGTLFLAILFLVTISPATVFSDEYGDPLTGIQFVLVKGGCYEMGDSFGDGARAEKPHEVCVSDFYLGKYEVTQGQWKKVMGSNPSSFIASDDHPVESVTWSEVQDFIRKLNQMSGKGYRLPTEAEWEFAARSGGKKEKWAGTSIDSELGEYAWFYDNCGKSTHPVGQKKPNSLGLYDMSGNVSEWVADWYGSKYYQNSPKDNPQGPMKGIYKVSRGGSWKDRSANIRVAYRFMDDPELPYSLQQIRAVGPIPEFLLDRRGHFGFRLSLSPP